MEHEKRIANVRSEDLLQMTRGSRKTKAELTIS